MIERANVMCLAIIFYVLFSCQAYAYDHNQETNKEMPSNDTISLKRGVPQCGEYFFDDFVIGPGANGGYRESKKEIPVGINYTTKNIRTGTNGTIIEYCVEASDKVNCSSCNIIVDYSFYGPGATQGLVPIPEPFAVKQVNINIDIAR